MQPDSIPVANGLSLRRALETDHEFLESLYSSTRDDLRQINAEYSVIEALIKMQHDLQMQGNAANYPNALHCIVERLGEPIGRVIVNFGSNEINILSIALIKAVRGNGYGSGVLCGLQQAAAKERLPLVLEVQHSNPKAKQLYQKLGFIVEQTGPIADRMIWRSGGINVNVA